jgi:hypothetical protein
MSPRVIDIKEFAERVERVCDFLLDKVKKDGSDDIRVLQQLKDDAADIQTDEIPNIRILGGLDDYMRGVQRSNDEVRSRGDQ